MPRPLALLPVALAALLALPPTAPPAAAQVAPGPPAAPDLGARDAVAPLANLGVLYFRRDLDPETAAVYWRDVHGPLAARIAGFEQYWQHRLGPPALDLWPALDGVDQRPAPDEAPQGIAETTIASEADRRTLADDPAAALLYDDERNVFWRTLLHATADGDSRTLLDRLSDAAPDGPQPHRTYLVLLRRRSGMSPEAFRDAVAPLAAAAAASPHLLKVRLHLFQPFDPSGWDTPGVSQATPPGGGYDALLEVAFADGLAERRFFESDAYRAVEPTLADALRTLHVYPRRAVFTLLYGGAPTLVGLRGYPAARAIRETGAVNQASGPVLDLLYRR